MDGLFILLYAFGVGSCVGMLLYARDKMKENTGLIFQGNIGVAFAATAGFAVFRLLNFLAAFWLYAEIDTALEKKA